MFLFTYTVVGESMKETWFLFIYAILKAFLPLPSLEVVLLPLNIKRPDLFLWYSIVGAVGTFIGGSIGYLLASLIEEEKWIKYFGYASWEKGKQLVQKYGVVAIFIGGVTPIPDFLLAYIAGVTRMSFIPFALSDGIARFLRSILVLYAFNQLGVLIDMDKYGMYILYFTIVYFVGKFFLNTIKSRVR